MQFIAVPVEHVQRIWHMVEDMLQMAVDQSGERYTTDWLLDDILHSNKLLWLLVDDDNDDKIVLALTTSIENYPNRRVIRVSFAGGEHLIKHIELARDEVKKFGKDAGCTKIEVLGRKGWERALKDLGFKLSYVCVEEDI